MLVKWFFLLLIFLTLFFTRANSAMAACADWVCTRYISGGDIYMDCECFDSGGNITEAISCGPHTYACNTSYGATCCQEGTNPGCFPAGTKINMSTGEQKNIENVKTGDKVISESETGQKSVSTVAKLETPISNNLCTIKYTNGDKLDLTKNHPIFTSLGWKSIAPEITRTEIPDITVAQLKVGDMVKKANDSFSTVASYSCKTENVQTYNLSLTGNNHTYFADNYLVHNKGSTCSCDVTGTTFITSIVRTSSTAFTVNWKHSFGGSCTGHYHAMLYIGTDYNAVNGNCNSADGNYDYRGQGGKLPFGCLAARLIDTYGPGSYNTAAGGLHLNPHTIYYVKAIAVYTGFQGGEDTSAFPCGGVAGPWATLGSCTLSPSSATMAVGDTQTFTTDAYQSEPIYVKPSTITSVGHWPGHVKCVGRKDDAECDYLPGYYRFYGDFGHSGDNPAFTVKNGEYRVLRFDYSQDGTNVKIQEDWLSPMYTGNLFTSDVKVSYPPPPSLIPPNNVDHVAYTKAPGVAYFNIISTPPDTPNPDTSLPYQAIVQAIKVTTIAAPLYSIVVAKNVPANAACSSSAAITGAGVVEVDPWWQVKDSDIQAQGDLGSKVPSSKFFGLNGSGNYPGVAAYSGSTDLTASNVSQTGWLANSPWSNPRVFDYSYFANQIPADVTPTVVDSGNLVSQITSSGSEQYGYYWYKYTGSGGTDLSLDAPLDIQTKKVILLVDNANFKINSDINLDDNQGFFMVIVTGNIKVDPGVGGGEGPNLEGLYVTDGEFDTGTLGTGNNDSKLSIRGSVVGYQGVKLQRDLGQAGNATTPSEFFEYAPDQIMLFPSKLGIRKINWKEVAP